MTDKKKDFAYTGDSEYEDALIGDREGLTRLRDAIDHALQHGETKCEQSGLEWTRVVRLESEPSGQVQSSLRTNLLLIGCFVVFLAAAAVFCLGIMKLIDYLW